MAILDLDTDAETIASRLSDPTTMLVVCLCAEWCGTCREYRAMFETLARSHPAACFVWIDVETHSEFVDELDVENFPTILIEDGVATRFFGTVLPQPRIVERMLEEFSNDGGALGGLKLRKALAAA
ncbi:thioredoxin family protein [Pararobbsia silviterrae]|uniref:Thioredoxin n=1 Tax=Pararobbsia silviterrae TaxID=1792498 RepID=A0A494Y914_9BURK|nr:thioredoxin family protein [Pararobbsia silviterrae]RKP58605.1 thioredoxin [Pararobbsia silviterrae]